MAFQSLPLSLSQLSLDVVLRCGQSFRWTSYSLPTAEREYRYCFRDRVLCLRQSPTALLYRAIYPDPQPSAMEATIKDAETLVFLKDYFNLDVDLEELYKDWSRRDKVFADAVSTRLTGIRMLRQDPWETLISFICSSNNNISRITKMVQNLCLHFSAPLLVAPSPGDELGPTFAYHPFPTPSALAQPDVGTKLRALGFGYRAEFIQRTSEMLVQKHGSLLSPTDKCEEPERWLKSLRAQDLNSTREELLKFVGVGRKVADCISLMALDKHNVIPVDTHVHQIAARHYGIKGGGKTNMTPVLYETISSKLVALWGDYAGWAHSVLFTADLKAFASPVGAKRDLYEKLDSKPNSPLSSMLPTPPLTPANSPLKRKSEAYFEGTMTSLVETASSAESIYERVKKRRRVRASVGTK